MHIELHAAVVFETADTKPFSIPLLAVSQDSSSFAHGTVLRYLLRYVVRTDVLFCVERKRRETEGEENMRTRGNVAAPISDWKDIGRTQRLAAYVSTPCLPSVAANEGVFCSSRRDCLSALGVRTLNPARGADDAIVRSEEDSE